MGIDFEIPKGDGIDIFTLNHIIVLSGTKTHDDFDTVNGTKLFDILKGFESVVIHGNDGHDFIELSRGIDAEKNDGKVSNVARTYVDAGAGDDFIMASDAVDTIDGGSGIDTAAWYYAETINMVEGLTYSANGQVDKFTGIENVQIDSFDDVKVIGDDGDNYITSSHFRISDSTDTLNGGAGNDILDGGCSLNFLTGGSGADQFVISADTNYEDIQKKDVITDFEKGVDKIVFRNSRVESMDDLEFVESTSDSTLIRTVDDCLIQVDNMVASQLDSSDFIF